MLYKLIKSNLLDEAMYQVARIEKMREQTNLRISRENMMENGRQNNESIQLNAQARMNEITEENRQKRMNESAKAKDETVEKLTTEFLKSHDKEATPIPAALYSQLTQTVEQDRVAIEEVASAPPPDPQQEQAMAEQPAM